MRMTERNKKENKGELFINRNGKKIMLGKEKLFFWYYSSSPLLHVINDVMFLFLQGKNIGKEYKCSSRAHQALKVQR